MSDLFLGIYHCETGLIHYYSSLKVVKSGWGTNIWGLVDFIMHHTSKVNFLGPTYQVTITRNKVMKQEINLDGLL